MARITRKRPLCECEMLQVHLAMPHLPRLIGYLGVRGPVLFAAAVAILLPSARADERRTPVDPTRPPWASIVRVQSNIGSRCTGVLIAPATVLSAAHCLYNPRTRAFLQAISLHVLLGYERGEYRFHRLVDRFSIGRATGPGKGSPATDWARLELSEPVPSTIVPLPIADVMPRAGMLVSLAGYNQDRTEVLLADISCHVVRTLAQPGGTLLVHDCAATRGTSGGPLLLKQDGGWAVLGINLAAGRELNLALAVTSVSP
jgi:protease YdgD